MRIRTLILCLLFGIVSAAAKDVITKTDGTQLDAKVEEITETLIRYHKASNPTGPLYTVPISSVASILYENGEVDTFNEVETPRPADVSQTTSPSDEELMRIAESEHEFTPQTGYVSDAELIQMYKKMDPLRRQARTYRLMGWIGGCVFWVAGVAGFMGSDSDAYAYGLVAVGGVLGAAWCLGFNLKANSLMKQARQMQSFSSTLFENDIMHLGNNSLTAGINLMGNRVANSRSLGLTLGLNF